jgi:serine/threonine-protein kinase
MTLTSRAHERSVEAYPTQIGRYEIVSTLGVGGMARVYLGLERGPHEATMLFAIKRLRTEVASDAWQRTLLADDARVALRLDHPNVVRTYEVVADPNFVFLSLELLQGQSLREVLSRLGRERMPLDEHLYVLVQALAGLEYAHTLADEAGRPLAIVHREVRPSNVFVTYAGEVKLLDFGLGRATASRTQLGIGVSESQLGYASPEQCLSHAVDARSDVYAAGVMLWEALARCRRAGEAADAMVQARLRDADLPIERVWPEVPSELASITHRALSPNPNDRFPSAAHLRREIERYLERSGSPAGQNTLAGLMTATFRKDLDKFRRTIDSHLRATRASQPPESRRTWRTPSGAPDIEDETRLFVRATDLELAPEPVPAVSQTRRKLPLRPLLFTASALLPLALSLLWFLTR